MKIEIKFFRSGLFFTVGRERGNKSNFIFGLVRIFMCHELVANWSQRFYTCFKILCKFFNKNISQECCESVANLTPRNFGKFTSLHEKCRSLGHFRQILKLTNYFCHVPGRSVRREKGQFIL